MEVKSVYNFVPAPIEDDVFKPDWAEQVSHDIPFSDGESGEIELTITAKTPIFIRNGHTKRDKELFEKQRDNKLLNPTQEEKEAIERYLSFSHVVKNGQKQFFIPATSIKGMIRNVLEIMSLSRMKQVEDNRYSFRDLSKSGNLYLSEYKKFTIRGGWLIQDGYGNWKIEECEEIAFIHHEELKKKGIPFRDLFLNKQPKEKTAKYKYSLVDKTLLTDTFGTYTKKLFGNVTRTMAKYSDSGRRGILVFTGQSSKRKEDTDKDGKLKASGKVHEFVFFDKEALTYLEVSQQMQKDFKFIYLDHDKQNISLDWKFWKEKLEKGKKVPVFYAKDEKGNLKHFGLAYMYKLPYKYSVKDLLDSSPKDLAEVIFGTTEDKNSTLKGRVFIPHAFSKNAIEKQEVKEILASPKASYFPFYLEQQKNGKPYKTYMDKDAKLRGFKRYYINEQIQTGKYDIKQLNNSKVFTVFKPLNVDAEFKCKIKFHNLRKVEIGALLSALTFHGTENKSYHTLGAAKPFGYGKIAISNINLKYLKFEEGDYLLEFEELMGSDWLKSDIMKELLTLAQIPEISVYPELDDFVKYKQDSKFLPKFSEITDRKPVIVSKIRDREIEGIAEQISLKKESYNSLKKQLEEELEYKHKELPEKLKLKLENAIEYIYKSHERSKRKLSNKTFSENYEWYKRISTWLGEERAKILYSKLTGKQITNNGTTN